MSWVFALILDLLDFVLDLMPWSGGLNVIMDLEYVGFLIYRIGWDS